VHGGLRLGVLDFSLSTVRINMGMMRVGVMGDVMMCDVVDGFASRLLLSLEMMAYSSRYKIFRIHMMYSTTSVLFITHPLTLDFI
jgi:hypothetical protein